MTEWNNFYRKFQIIFYKSDCEKHFSAHFLANQLNTLLYKESLYFSKDKVFSHLK